MNFDEYEWWEKNIFWISFLLFVDVSDGNTHSSWLCIIILLIRIGNNTYQIQKILRINVYSDSKKIQCFNIQIDFISQTKITNIRHLYVTILGYCIILFPMFSLSNSFK